MFREDGSEPQIKKLQDGFAYNEEDFLNLDGSRFDIHFLHGALHLFEYDAIVKLNYSKTQDSLKNQFIKLIKDQKKMPLFVAEGSSHKKLVRIHSSGYLTRCLNSLQKIGSKKNPSAFFTYGVSFSPNDDHIVHALSRNKCHKFYIGIFGDPNNAKNKATIARAQNIKTRRGAAKNSVPTDIFYYDVSSAKVWG